MFVYFIQGLFLVEVSQRLDLLLGYTQAFIEIQQILTKGLLRVLGVSANRIHPEQQILAPIVRS